MLLALRASSAFAFILAVIWVIFRPGFDSAVAALGALAVLISAFLVTKMRAGRRPQSQDVSGGSIGIQAGRDANVHKINR